MITIRQGETLLWSCSVEFDIAGWDVAAQLRRSPQTTTSVDLTCVVGSDTGTFTVNATPEETASWTATAMVCDIRFTSPVGVVTYSDSFMVDVVEPVTR